MEITDVFLIGIIVGLVQLVKYVGVPKKLLPIISLVLGVAGGVVYMFPNDAKSGILVGLIMGLAASGFYSGSKEIIKGDK